MLISEVHNLFLKKKSSVFAKKLPGSALCCSAEMLKASCWEGWRVCLIILLARICRGHRAESSSWFKWEISNIFCLWEGLFGSCVADWPRTSKKQCHKLFGFLGFLCFYFVCWRRFRKACLTLMAKTQVVLFSNSVSIVCMEKGPFC